MKQLPTLSLEDSLGNIPMQSTCSKWLWLGGAGPENITSCAFFWVLLADTALVGDCLEPRG